MHAPKRVGHVVLNVSDLDASTKFYTEVLGFEIARQSDFGTFLTCGKIHHDVALFQAPEGARPVAQDQIGLNHMAIQVEDMDALKVFYHRFKAHGVNFDRLTEHSMTSSIYFFDPDGSIRIEFFCNTTETAEEGLALMRAPGRGNRELVLEDTTA